MTAEHYVLSVAFKNLREEIAELFAEEAPSRFHRHLSLQGVRVSQPLDLKHARSAAWNAAHPLKCRLASEKYRAKNPDVLKAWKAANPDKVRAARLREFTRRKERRRDYGQIVSGTTSPGNGSAATVTEPSA